MVFYGVACLLRGFVIRNFVLVLAPAYASDALLLPMFLAAVSMTMWLLVRGVDVAKWEEKVATCG